MEKRTMRLVEETGRALEPPRLRRYEDLDGQEGRAVYFRPHRYTAAELAPLRGVVTVTLASGRSECPLLDVSQSGVAVAWPAGVPAQKGRWLPATLRFDQHPSFQGRVRVGSVRETPDGTVVGLSFDNFLLDVDEVLQLRTVRAWAAEAGGHRVQERPWGLPAGERFQARVAEMRLLMEDARAELDALERRLPWHALHDDGGPVLTGLASALRSGFVPEFVRLSEAVDFEIRALPGGHQNAAAREWAERHLQSLIMESPACRRAREKPFGYPGDYEVMNFIYERVFDGGTLFSRAVTLGFSEAVCSKAVRFRKDLVKRQLQALLSRRAGSREPVRVLSIASGPAQELFELFQDAEEIPAPLEVVLFEQDKNALAHAWRRLTPVVESRFAGRVRLLFLHDSVKRLLRDGNLFAPFGKFDLVYSCGLYDYLQQRTGVILTRHLANATVPGGQLLVANMVDHAGRMLQEIHLDWPLIYRTREEILDLGRHAVPGAQVRMLEEESGVNPFFELVRG
jgi:extracellular factor (EF) 3-hydroxypalmitic acid methyl ester biosynthesis protein